MVPIVSCTGDEATYGPKLLTFNANLTPQADELLSKLWQSEVLLHIWGRSVLSGSQRTFHSQGIKVCAGNSSPALVVLSRFLKRF
jgi:hypothetical protein